MNNNKNIKNIRPISSKFDFMNPLLQQPISKTLKFKKIYKNFNKKDNNIANTNNNINNNNVFFDNLSEKVLNLYDLGNSIKSNDNNEIYSIKLNNINPKYYINNYITPFNKKNIQKKDNILKSRLITNDLSLTLNKNNKTNYGAIILNKNNKSEIRKKNNIKIRNINYIKQNSNNISNNYDFSSFSNYNYVNTIEGYGKIKNYKISNFKLKFIKLNSNKINDSPVGHFDNYFFNSNYKQNNRKKLLNKQFLYTDNINNDLNKKLTIESPTYSFKINSPGEMSIENKNEYDANNMGGKQIFSKKVNKSKKIDIPIREFHSELKIKNNDDNNYRTINLDINSIFNLNQYKFRSNTVNQLIKDVNLKNENKEKKEIKSSCKENNYKQIFNDINKKIERIKNKLNIIKINQKLVNNKDINITISPQVNKKNKIIKINNLNKKSNNIINNILINNKKIKKSFIPKNPNYNRFKTIDNSITLIANNLKNDVNSPTSNINYLQKIKINKNNNYKKSSFEVNPQNLKDKNNCSKFNETPTKLLNEKNSENIIHNIDIYSPKYNINLAKRILRNNINKNNYKVLNDIKNTLTNIRNNRSYQLNDIK